MEKFSFMVHQNKECNTLHKSDFSLGSPRLEINLYHDLELPCLSTSNLYDDISFYKKLPHSGHC